MERKEIKKDKISILKGFKAFMSKGKSFVEIVRDVLKWVDFISDCLKYISDSYDRHFPQTIENNVESETKESED